MKKRTGNPVYLFAVIIVAAFLSFSFWDLPSFRKADDASFDSDHVIADIEVISKDRHSVIHPEARAEVRDYLVRRLETFGAQPRIYHYDSLEARGYTFDIDNIVAEFPVEGSDTYLLMVAHYDSRYPWVPVKDTTCSYGAADDGYGVGIILETVSLALQKKDAWKQGLRVVFTDAEEVGMVGMKTLYNHHKELFDDVGLMINIEARGPYGPALLFETSPGADKIIDFYSKHSRQHHTYSLTNVVYSFLPNFTDFTIVKDSIPGMNFSAISDINHYHTSLDNFSAVNKPTIDHYGAQITPLVMEYLTGEEYGDRSYFRGGKDRTFFTIPVLGMFNFSKTLYWIINIVIILLMVVVLVLDRCRIARALKGAGVTLGFALAALAFGLLATWLGCLVSGAAFKPFGVITGMMFDNALMIICAIILTALLAWYHCRHQDKEVLYGAYIAVAVISLGLLLAIGETMLLMVVFAFSVLSVFLWKLTDWKIFLLAGVGLSCLHAFSFLYSLAMALTVGASGAVFFIMTFDLMMILPMCVAYLNNQR